MSISLRQNIRQLLKATAIGVITFGVTACSTTSPVKVTKKVPITYKAGQGSTQYASLTIPQAPQSTYSAQQSYSAPQVSIPQTYAAPMAPRPATPVFDQSRIDRDLYKHQKVGKTYTIMGKSYTPKHNPDYDEEGIASWYGDKFHGKPTATGEIYDKNDLTAAHKTLPLNSWAYVTNLENGRTLMVRLNDRGPFIGDRIIDLSEAAANALGTKGQGLGKVRVQYAGPADANAAKRVVAAPSPQYSAPAPIAAPRPVQEYAPLRQQPQAQAQAQAPYSAPTPQFTEPHVPAPIAPQAPVPAAPQGEPENGGQVTLTIKGPIHMAVDNGDYAKPVFLQGGIKTK